MELADMTKDETMKLALVALEDRTSLFKWQTARDAVREALAQPAQRPWVGLTDGELSELSASGLALWALWRAIEAKLKHKNTSQ